MKQEAIGPIALLCAGAVFNLTLIISLHRTWRHWNQMKWYIVMLTAGNTLEVLFTLTTLLGSTVSDSWLGGDVSCKFLMFMNPLGPSIANMALAALALHTLLTAITGCQGNSLRHVVVLGLFALLSLPLPLSKIPIFGVVTYETFNKVLSTCTDLGFFHEADPHYRFYYFVAGSVALVFFPLIVIIGAIGGTFMLSCCLPTTENEKSEKNTADVVLTTVLGTILMLLCVPLHVFIFMRDDIMNKETVMVYSGLVYVFYSKVSLTALVCVIFAYAHVYRKGVQKTAPSGRETGERTKLMK